MNLKLGDIVTGLEYCGDQGVVRKITTIGAETVYELSTSRSDGFTSVLNIGFNKAGKLMVEYGGMRGGKGWSRANWELKVSGNTSVSFPTWYTLFEDTEASRDD